MHRARGQALFFVKENRHDRAALLHLSVVEKIRHLGYWHDRDLTFTPLGKPLLRCTRFQPRCELLFDLFNVLQTLLAEKQIRIVPKFGKVEHIAKRSPLSRCEASNAKPSLFCFVNTRGKDRPEAIDAKTAYDVAMH
ncbi:hypothetical protein XI09_12355 [Bradyrhizobium sp. CCBAU 11386]|nr:hypothetical protein [Bradyrhizobium sp. CCBAU 11386]